MDVFGKIRKAWKLPGRKLCFGAFGNSSDIRKPLLITGKKNIFIGNHVFIREMARIEAICQYRNQAFSPACVIDDGVTIEQNVHITCANRVRIGKETTISSFVYISDCAHSFDQPDCNVLDQELKISEVEIGDYSFLGTGVKILPGVHLGRNVIVGANAVVTKDIPAYSVAVGIPAKVIQKYDAQAKKWVKV